MSAPPNNWIKVQLGDFADIQLGKMLDKAKNFGQPRTYLRNINVRWFGFDLSDLNEMMATDHDAEFFAIKDGDVLICEGGEPGRAAVWNMGNAGLIYQKALHRVRTAPVLLPSLLTQQLRLDAFSSRLERHFSGSTIKHFPAVALNRYEVLVPPAPEQTRIADKLDTVLARVDACRDRLARVAPLLKRFRQSVLAAATSGRLTEEWRGGSALGDAKAELDAWIQLRAKTERKPPVGPDLSQGFDSVPPTWAVASVHQFAECLDRLRVPVKSRQLIHPLVEQFRPLGLPLLERLDG
jgi:type I restriction enzyme, S subunit